MSEVLHSMEQVDPLTPSTVAQSMKGQFFDCASLNEGSSTSIHFAINARFRRFYS
jgi:hypothetical protein